MEDLLKEIKALEKRVSELETKPKKEKKKRELSKYNQYVSEAMKRLKLEHPELKNSDLMKRAAKEWSENKDKLNL